MMKNPDDKNTDIGTKKKLLTESNYKTAFSGTIIMLLGVLRSAPEYRMKRLGFVFLVPVTYLAITWIIKYIKAYSDEKMNPKVREWVMGILVIVLVTLFVFSFV